MFPQMNFNVKTTICNKLLNINREWTTAQVGDHVVAMGTVEQLREETKRAGMLVKTQEKQFKFE